MTLTFATLFDESVVHAERHGFGDRRVYVSYKAWSELLDPLDMSVQPGGYLLLHGPAGAIKVAPSTRLCGDARDWAVGLSTPASREARP